MIHHYSAFNTNIYDFEIIKNNYDMHMINLYFQAPFSISRKKLHNTFIEHGFYSRFDSNSKNICTNLRFHYNKDNIDNIGKCESENKTTCSCKCISVSCFKSGKINVTGLSDISHGKIVYKFLEEFYSKFKSDIISIE